MKVGNPTNVVNLFGFVQDKQERQQRKQSRDGKKDKDQDNAASDAEGEPDSGQFADKMTEAVQAFQNDPQAQASGLSASTTGAGPGLKVVLKDGSGAVVRQISGEEFLKLREAVSNQKARGKILDQKF